MISGVETMSRDFFQYASVVVPTYNRPDALEAVLLSLAEQTCDDFEVVVADDGSTGETAQAIARLRDTVGYDLKHARQEDDGFRAARVRNLGSLATEGDYIIFLDGDCLVLPDFIETHRWLAERGWWVRGHRVDLNEGLTRRVLARETEVTGWPLWRWAIARAMGQVHRVGPLVRYRAQAFRKGRSHRWAGARSCNLGIWRDDFVAVDGFDESYVGYSREDSDLVIRLINNGVLRKEGKNAVSVIHLWHLLETRAHFERNDELMREVLESGATRARSGLSQHRRNDQV